MNKVFLAGSIGVVIGLLSAPYFMDDGPHQPSLRSDAPMVPLSEPAPVSDPGAEAGATAEKAPPDALGDNTGPAEPPHEVTMAAQEMAAQKRGDGEPAGTAPSPPPAAPLDEAAPQQQDGAARPVNWRMASAFGSGLTQMGTLGVALTEKLRRLSGDDVVLRFFEPNAIVPADRLFDAVANGTVDSAWSTPGYWSDKNEALAVFSAVPFGPPASEYIAWIYHGGGQELLDKIYAPHGIKSLICGVTAPEGAGWFRRPITGVADLEGLKIRFFGLGARVLRKLGAEPQVLRAQDVFKALETGEIDGAEFSMPAIDQNMDFHEVARHYYFPGWHQQATLLELMVNREKWRALSDRQRAQIEIACGDNVRAGLAEGEAIQAQALAALQRHGVQLHRWPPEVLEALQAAWLEVAAELALENESFREVWASLQKFRKDNETWKELGYL